MAGSLRKSVLTLTSKFLCSSPMTLTVPVGKTFLTPHIATRGLTVSLSRNLYSAGILNRNKHVNRHGILCGCCSVHTEGDAKLASFLEEEIKNESKFETNTTSIENWNVKTDGTGVILTKKFNDELITVEFDVNHTVDDEGTFEEGGQDESAPEMVSRPPFEVLIEKKSGKKLRFACEFNTPESPSQDDVNDMFYFVEVRIGDELSADGIDKFYSHLGSVMDSTLYDLLMDMLDERGIDDDFINNMVSYATNYEHQLYLKFLSDLKSIINEK